MLGILGVVLAFVILAMLISASALDEKKQIEFRKGVVGFMGILIVIIAIRVVSGEDLAVSFLAFVCWTVILIINIQRVERYQELKSNIFFENFLRQKG